MHELAVLPAPIIGKLIAVVTLLVDRVSSPVSTEMSDLAVRGPACACIVSVNVAVGASVRDDRVVIVAFFIELVLAIYYRA